MNFKRPLEGEPGSGSSDRVPKRRLTPSSSFLRNASFSLEDLVNKMEPVIRRVVREQIDRIIPILLASSSRNLNNPIQSNGEEAHLILQFINNLPETVFTGNKIQADGNSRVLIELTDSRTGSRITTGPLSSLKIDIVALNGDFDSENSTFNEKIVVERKGRRPILNGDLTITMTQGLGCLENVVFTDNSSWLPCGKFQLGARVSPKSRGVEERVQEASSRAFKVKDHRGLGYKKHHPPYPNDKVWRLEQIAKDGTYCARLASEGIETVKDFLRFQEIDSSRLKKILGGEGNEISDRTWETIIGHTGECKIEDSEMFTYTSPEFPNLELLFDQVYRVKGVTFDGREYCPVEKLNVPQRILVENLKRQALENSNRLTPVKGSLALGPSRDLTSSAADRFLVQQDISETLQDFGSTSASTSCYEAPGSHFSEVSGPPIFYYSEDAILPPTVTENFRSVDNPWSQRLHGANNFSPSTSSGDQNGPQFYVSANFPANLSWTADDFSALFANESEPGNLTSFASNFTFCIGTSNEAGPSFNVIHGTARSRVAWCQIRAALKWRSVRRNIAARRNLTATRHQVFCQ